MWCDSHLSSCVVFLLVGGGLMDLSFLLRALLSPVLMDGFLLSFFFFFFFFLLLFLLLFFSFFFLVLSKGTMDEHALILIRINGC